MPRAGVATVPAWFSMQAAALSTPEPMVSICLHFQLLLILLLQLLLPHYNPEP